MLGSLVEILWLGLLGKPDCMIALVLSGLRTCESLGWLIWEKRGAAHSGPAGADGIGMSSGLQSLCLHTAACGWPWSHTPSIPCSITEIIVVSTPVIPVTALVPNPSGEGGACRGSLGDA